MFLLDHGAKVNVKKASDGDSPLHLTSNHDTLAKVAQTLLEKGAETQAENADGM